MIFLRGKQLQSMYKPCYMDAQASTNKSQAAPPLDAASPTATVSPAHALAPARAAH
jgi:hypothetical protein